MQLHFLLWQQMHNLKVFLDSQLLAEVQIASVAKNAFAQIHLSPVPTMGIWCVQKYMQLFVGEKNIRWK